MNFTLITYGLAEILECLAIINSNRHISFKIGFSNSVIRILRPEYPENYYENQKNFLIQQLDSLENAEYSEEPFPPMTTLELINNTGTTTITPHKIIFDSYNHNYKNYLIINTKLLWGRDKDFNSGTLYDRWINEIKYPLFDIINEHNLSLMLIGEKYLGKCTEYTMHDLWEIYDDIVSSDACNIIDLTVPTTPDLYKKEIIDRNISLLKDSMFNIHIGEGGGLKLFSYINDLVAFTSIQSQPITAVNSYDSNTFLNLIKTKIGSRL